ncbi:MAG: PIG-L family deacetylase [Candidatus Eisenbacteria bacterium]|nr:PIG-L family deacetylase [Candidatus Eisenbacteria bacterium]
MNVLAIGAHPDDIELSCGGTLAKYSRAGNAVSMAIVCNGVAGRGDRAPEEIVRVRREGSTSAAAVIGASVFHLGYPDHAVPVDEDIKIAITEVIRQARPLVVISHAPEDCYLDHERVSQLVEECIYLAPYPEVETDSPPLTDLPLLYYMDTVTGLGFEPEEFVDVTDVFDLKRQMLGCHQTQFEIQPSDTSDSPPQMMEVAARFRGIQCGVRYAEGFRVALKWGRVGTHRFLP